MQPLPPGNDQDGTTNQNDAFSSDTIGVRYDIAGGLRIGLLTQITTTLMQILLLAVKMDYNCLQVRWFLP